MTKNTDVDDVRDCIENLIKAGTSFDVDALEKIYHDDLQVIMIDEQGQTIVSDKKAFKGLFETKREQGDPPLNTWAEFHRIDATETNAHVLISRKVKLMEDEQRLILSIDLIKEDGRWQVIREVIFARPEATS